MGLIKGTHHVALKCSGAAQYEKTVHFYKDILGLEMMRSWGEGNDAGCMLNTGNSIIELFASGAVSDKTGSINHFALTTDDVAACLKAVSEAGYKVTVECSDIVIESDPAFPIQCGFCVGEVGEEIEFFTEK